MAHRHLNSMENTLPRMLQMAPGSHFIKHNFIESSGVLKQGYNKKKYKYQADKQKLKKKKLQKLNCVHIIKGCQSKT